MRLVRTSFALFVLLVTCLALVGCNEEGRMGLDDKEDDSEAAAEEAEREQLEVDLPSPPPDEAFDIPEKNDDGTFRVEGLIFHQNDHLEEKVEVKGVVTEVLGDCDPAVAKQRDETCPQPHFVIKDEEDAKDELMVVGFPREFFDKARVGKGDTETFKGRYLKSSGQFVNSESGLIELSEAGETKVAENE
ncbi:MAG: hypothetical protein ACOCV2_12560 [Persicimonas sp.]